MLSNETQLNSAKHLVASRSSDISRPKTAAATMQVQNPMIRVASYGQEYTFTHLAACASFPDCEIISFGDFGQLARAVVGGDCDFGLAPFYNTNKTGILDAQTALYAHLGEVFVIGIVAKRIRHVLCGFGSAIDCEEIRSKDVVFEQCSGWLNEHCPTANHDGVKFLNTAAAIESLKSLNDRDRMRIAAIGTREAAAHHGIDVISDGIENPKNVTLFWKLSRHKPDALNLNRLLLLIKEPDDAKLDSLAEEIETAGFRISMPWRMPSKNAYFMEITGTYDKLNLFSFSERLEKRSDVMKVSGYNESIPVVLQAAMDF